jgi:2-amino-4-hydroxy-6-hydroxymethyldihydropteridine diphosphokinase
MTRPLPDIVYVALGSNLGDRAALLAAARDEIAKISQTACVRASSIIENEALTLSQEVQSPYLNQVVECRTTLTPHEFLEALLRIERTLGRLRTHRWAARTIDLDIILFGARIIESAALCVPHPQMRARQFVLQPLFELNPGLTLPTGERIARLLEALPHASYRVVL